VNDIVPMDNIPPAPIVKQVSVADRIKSNAEVIKALAPEIRAHHILNDGDKQYMKVGGGIACAQALGYAITVSAVKFDRESDDVPFYTATASLIDTATGIMVATAEGYVGLDESRWTDAALYARRSMTQTRAVAKLCRINFGAMYVLLGASTDTPAEEIPDRNPIRRPAAATVQARPAAKALPSKTGGKGQTLTAVEVVEAKRGQGAKGEWVMYKVTFAEGMSAKTFSGAHVKTINKAMADGVMVEAVLEEGKFGFDLKEVRLSNVRIDDGDDVPAQPDTTPLNDEEIPF
jgi:hypothetical protein